MGWREPRWPSAERRSRRRPAGSPAAGLQRGRLTGLTLRGDDLIDASRAARQISFDDTREARLLAQQAMDRVRDKYGPAVIGPATVFRHAS
ncbi:hypothetical protein ACIQ6Y_37515 [Streptomyces sp. NPDC096205]|uniref:hypothetical protein n=1 Tax=Streptomyces sp. NPDC096205 TaxID=3366081 RepID=UPI0037F15329